MFHCTLRSAPCTSFDILCSVCSHVFLLDMDVRWIMHNHWIAYWWLSLWCIWLSGAYILKVVHTIWMLCRSCPGVEHIGTSAWLWAPGNGWGNSHHGSMCWTFALGPLWTIYITFPQGSRAMMGIGVLHLLFPHTRPHKPIRLMVFELDSVTVPTGIRLRRACSLQS